MTVSLKNLTIQVLVELGKQKKQLVYINTLLHLPLTVHYLCVVIIKELG